MSDEVDRILAQADDLISHEPDIHPDVEDLIDEAVVDAAEPDEDVPAEEDYFTEEVSTAETEESEDVQELPTEEPAAEIQISDDVAAEIDDDFQFDFGFATKNDAQTDLDLEFGLPDSSSVAGLFGDNHALEEEAKPRKKKRGWIGGVILLLILALLGGGAYYYYDTYYLLPIDSMAIDGFEDSLTVHLSTGVDESLLTVVCTDTYGNKQEEPVLNGSAFFTDLNANTMYKITVVADGFHKVDGAISGSYTTAEETRIVDFSAKAGIQDGSVILNFTVETLDGSSKKSQTKGNPRQHGRCNYFETESVFLSFIITFSEKLCAKNTCTGDSSKDADIKDKH